MRRSGWLATWFLLASVAVPTTSLAAGHLNFFVGQKMLEEDDWPFVEDQGEFGAQITIGPAEWPIHVAIDVLGSSDKEETIAGIEFEGQTGELDLGARKIWGKKNLHPFLGGGLAFVRGEFGTLSIDDSDSELGYWVDAGAFWRLGARFNLGFDVRLSRAEVEISGTEVEAGGEHVGVLLGFGW